MKRLHFTKANSLSNLHDELLAAVPILRPITRLNGDRIANCIVEGDQGNVWLTVPDAADDAAIAAVVDAHDALAVRPLTAEQQAWAAATTTEKMGMIAKRLGFER